MFNLYLDFSNKSTQSRKTRGFSAYLGLLLTSVYLMIPSLVYLSNWFIVLWVVIGSVAFVYREALVAALLNGSKRFRAIKILFWSTGEIAVLLSGGGYYPNVKRIFENLGEGTDMIYLSSVLLLFSLWFLVFAQSTIARFTKFEN
jgi:hypothetical protein